MDWLVRTLAVAGVTVVLGGALLWLSARRLGAGRRAVEGPRRTVAVPLRAEDHSAEDALRRWRTPWFERGIEVGAAMDRGITTVVVLGFRGRRWELALGSEAPARQEAVLTGPDGDDAEALIALLQAP